MGFENDNKGIECSDPFERQSCVNVTEIQVAAVKVRVTSLKVHGSHSGGSAFRRTS